MFCEKKNLSVRRKKIFKVWRGEKKCKCRISGVRKKKELKEKFREKKNQSVLGVEILLSSCSLVGLYVNLQVKVTEKKKFQSIFRVGV